MQPEGWDGMKRKREREKKRKIHRTHLILPVLKVLKNRSSGKEAAGVFSSFSPPPFLSFLLISSSHPLLMILLLILSLHLKIRYLHLKRFSPLFISSDSFYPLMMLSFFPLELRWTLSSFSCCLSSIRIRFHHRLLLLVAQKRWNEDQKPFLDDVPDSHVDTSDDDAAADPLFVSPSHFLPDAITFSPPFQKRLSPEVFVSININMMRIIDIIFVHHHPFCFDSFYSFLKRKKLRSCAISQFQISMYATIKYGMMIWFKEKEPLFASHHDDDSFSSSSFCFPFCFIWFLYRRRWHEG